MPPYRSAVARYIPWTLSGLVTSTFWKTASRPSAAVCSPASSTTSATQTLAPSREKRSAASRPMPLAAPVMTTTLLSSRPMRAASLTRFETRHERVEPSPAGVDPGFPLLVPPGEHDVRPVALVRDVGAGELVEVPEDAARVALERLSGLLVFEQRPDGLGPLGLDHVHAEDPIRTAELLGDV